MTTLTATYINDVYMRLSSDNEGTLYEIREKFTFLVPNHKYMKKYKDGLWDGKIRLFNVVNRTLYIGLLGQLKRFCKANNIDLVVDEKILPQDETFTKEEFSEFVKTLDLRNEAKENIFPYVHQWVALATILQNKRATILSPTASGKSLIAYILIRWLQYKGMDKKILIVVPTTSLVEQMYKDFDDYSSAQLWSSKNNVHKIYDYQGMSKTSDLPVYISTWQSIYKMNKKYFSQFGAIFVDEAHQSKAESLTGILEKATSCSYKAGMTGTLDGAEANEWVIEGLLGEVKQVATTEELIQKGIVSNIEIRPIQISYPKQDGLFVRSHCKKYPDETSFIENHEGRNKFIANLGASQKENTLILFSKINHGRELMKIFKEKHPDKEVYFIHGSVTKKESGIPIDAKGISKKDMNVLLKEEIRSISEKNTGIIVVATYGVFSTGINIKNLHNIIFASSTKSKIRVLQSIGRSLRLHITKEQAVVYDLVDDFSTKSYQNHSLRHFLKRFKYYVNEKFKYKIIKIKL